MRWRTDPEFRKKKLSSSKAWKDANPETAKKICRKHRELLKKEVLTHYGKGGKLLCCWYGCVVRDVDMLTLDHTNNDGAEHRKAIGGGRTVTYRFLKKSEFPKGFKTLCWNHQWKKEISRLKGRKQYGDAM